MSKIETLADFKRYLAMPEAKLQLTGIAWFTPETKFWRQLPVHNSSWRKVGKVQTKMFTLVDEEGKPSWITFGKADEWEFNDWTATNTAGDTRLTYQISEIN